MTPQAPLPLPVAAYSAPAAAGAAAHGGSRDAALAREQAEAFEGVFLTVLVEQMFSGIDTGGPFGGGHAESQYRSMLAEHLAQEIARSGGVGLADHVWQELIAAQEAGR